MRDPLEQYSVTMHAGSGHTPRYDITFGCRTLAMMPASCAQHQPPHPSFSDDDPAVKPPTHTSPRQASEHAARTRPDEGAKATALRPISAMYRKLELRSAAGVAPRRPGPLQVWARGQRGGGRSHLLQGVQYGVRRPRAGARVQRQVVVLLVPRLPVQHLAPPQPTAPIASPYCPQGKPPLARNALPQSTKPQQSSVPSQRGRFISSSMA